MNSLSTSTLLIVDDDPFLREGLKRSLRGEPYRILTASSAEEALDILGRENVDVALSDEHMPNGMRGTDFLVQLKRKYPDVIRMMLTGHVRYETAMRAINDGRVFKFISKPCDTVELAISIRYAMQHKLLQDAFRQSEERFRRMSEAAFEGIAFTEKGRITDVNQKFLAMFGYEYAEVIGKKVLDFGASEHHSVACRNLAKKPEYSYETVCLRKDGSSFPAEVYGRTVTFEGHQVTATAVRDVTERKRAEQALIKAKEEAENATRTKDNFVALVSHNLKSPIISMMSILQLYIEKGFSPNAESDAMLDKVMRSAMQTISMTNELLDYSRLQGGTLRITPKFIDASEMAERSITSLGGMAAAKGITVVNEIPKDSRIYADPHLFGEVIQNLVSNAIKFTRKGGRITIFAPEGMMAAVAVRDTGIGISEQALSRIFVSDAFNSTAGTEGEKGTGLGLPMSMNIMKSHGGSLKAESKVGEGSVFYAILPHVQPVALLFGLGESSRPVVEECLHQIGAKTVFSPDAKEAVEAARKNKPHLMITESPDGGDESLAHIEKIRIEADCMMIPAMVVTPDGRVEPRGISGKPGAVDVINATASPAEIIRLLRFMLS